MKSIKNWFLIFILVIIYIFVCAYSYVQAVSNDLKESVFRLHVIANSDSKEDQDLKLLVRDNLLSYMNDLCKDCTSKEEAIKIARLNIDTFNNIASQTIIDEGFNYDVNVEIGEYDFPTKTYGDISLPSGTYDALEVKIGKAKGHNWWCVMFPPLCFVDISSGVVPDESKDVLKDKLTEEEFALVSNSNNLDINFKFKILELFSNSKLMNQAKN